VHTRISGVADHFAVDDEHALGIVRGDHRPSRAPPARSVAPARAAAARSRSGELYGIIPSDARHAYDVRDVIARLVDGSDFAEFKARYGTTLVCGFARLEGHPIGILANNGILFSESALKGTHFIELCCRRGIPLLSCRTSPAS